MQPVNNVGFLIQHTAFSLYRQSDQVLQERLGVGFSQFKIMRVLERKPHLQQKQIAQALGQTEASVSRQIKLLQEKGLLQSTVSPQNRREHITTLTPKGVRFTEEAIRVLGDYFEPTFNYLSEKQQKALIEGLQILHRQLCMSEDGNGLCQQFMNE